LQVLCHPSTAQKRSIEKYTAHHMYRDARVMRIYAGTNEIMKLLIARSL